MLWLTHCRVDLIMSLLMLRLCRRSFLDLICVAYARNDHCVALQHALESEEFKDSDINLSARMRASLHRYSIDQGLLCYCTDVEDAPRIVVPHDEDLKYRILLRRMIPPLVGI